MNPAPFVVGESLLVRWPSSTQYETNGAIFIALEYAHKLTTLGMEPFGCSVSLIPLAPLAITM